MIILGERHIKFFESLEGAGIALSRGHIRDAFPKLIEKQVNSLYMQWQAYKDGNNKSKG